MNFIMIGLFAVFFIYYTKLRMMTTVVVV